MSIMLYEHLFHKNQCWEDHNISHGHKLNYTYSCTIKSGTYKVKKTLAKSVRHDTQIPLATDKESELKHTGGIW